MYISSMLNIPSLYIHFPFCKHLCNYCDFYKHKFDDSEKQRAQYQDWLNKALESHQKLLDENRFEISKLDTLYIGGGTPSLWGLQGVSYIGDKFKNYSPKEFTIEVDPRTYSTREIKAWEDIGVNRFSLGLQAFNDDYLKLLDRKHTKDEVKQTLKDFSGKNYSVDLLIGAPKFSSARNIKSEIDELISYGPKHFSVYILKTRKNYPLIEKLPSDDEVSEEYLEVCEYLESQGYRQYEVSNFAQDGFRSEHNLNYWRYKSVAAIGQNATGLLSSPEKVIRYQWKSSSSDYVIEELSGESLRIEQVYLGLRHKGDFDLASFFASESEKLNKLLNQWDKLGYLDKNSAYHLTSKGFLMLDSIIGDLFSQDML